MQLLTSPMTRRLMRELLATLLSLGVRRVVADWAEGHTLPLAHLREDGRYEMRVQEWCERFMPADHPDRMPYPDDPAPAQPPWG
ncbi:MAG: hypothetical protein QM750_11890 [Rubrivivax sp.]